MTRSRRFAMTAVLMAIGLCLAHAATAYQSQKAPGHSQAVPAPEDRVDINTASFDQLMKTPGMTRTWAVRIIRYRPYRAKNDLVDKGVVSNQAYGRIKDYIIAHRSKQ